MARNTRIAEHASEYDILHLHYPYYLCEYLQRYKKPVVMHYHGTEVATQTHMCKEFDRMPP
jgi:hypothetical protein